MNLFRRFRKSKKRDAAHETSEKRADAREPSEERVEAREPSTTQERAAPERTNRDDDRSQLDLKLLALHMAGAEGRIPRRRRR
jgi:hypothetical protein